MASSTSYMRRAGTGSGGISRDRLVGEYTGQHPEPWSEGSSRVEGEGLWQVGRKATWLKTQVQVKLKPWMEASRTLWREWDFPVDLLFACLFVRLFTIN